MQSRVGIGGLLALSCLIVGCASKSPTPDTSRERVRETFLYCDSEIEAAAVAYNRGGAFERNGDLDSAEFYYLQAIEADSGYCDAMDNLGRLYRALGQYDQAEYWYRRSIGILPDNDVAIMNLALCFRVQGLLDSAVVYYNQVKQLHPLDPEGDYGLGTCYFDAGDYELAVDFFLKAEEVYVEQNSPWAADAWAQLSLAYLYLDSLERSKQFATSTLQVDSTSAYANYSLGVYYLFSEPQDLDLAHGYLKVARQGGLSIPSSIVEVFPDLK